MTFITLYTSTPEWRWIVCFSRSYVRLAAVTLRASNVSRRFRLSHLKIVNTLKTYRRCSRMACGHRGLRLFNCYHGLHVTTGSHPTTTAAGPKENTKGSAAASSSTSAGSRSLSGSTTTQREQPAQPTKRWQRWRLPIILRTCWSWGPLYPFIQTLTQLKSFLSTNLKLIFFISCKG